MSSAQVEVKLLVLSHSEEDKINTLWTRPRFPIGLGPTGSNSTLKPVFILIVILNEEMKSK